jgi:hypothetical protein
LILKECEGTNARMRPRSMKRAKNKNVKEQELETRNER